MARDAVELLKDALALPAAARGAPIDSLVGHEEAWREEISRRLQQIDDGVVQLIPWQDARRRLRSRFDR